MFSCKVRKSSYLEWNPERMSEVSEVSGVSDVLRFQRESPMLPSPWPGQHRSVSLLTALTGYSG